MAIIPIVTNINQLRIPCELVTKEDNIKQIIVDLKDTLASKPEGIGLTANQIGYTKAISYIRIPIKEGPKTKQIEYKETIMINAKIEEKIGKPFKLINEGCLSFKGIHITTKRYVFIMVTYLNEHLKEQRALLQDLEALAFQHECDHQTGITLFQRKWVAR